MGSLWQDNGLVPDHNGHDHEMYEPPGSSLQAAPQEGRTARYQAALSPAHLRYNTPHGRQASQVRAGAPRARKHKHHAGHLLSRDLGDGRWAGGCHVRRPASLLLGATTVILLSASPSVRSLRAALLFAKGTARIHRLPLAYDGERCVRGVSNRISAIVISAAS